MLKHHPLRDYGQEQCTLGQAVVELSKTQPTANNVCLVLPCIITSAYTLEVLSI